MTSKGRSARSLPDDHVFMDVNSIPPGANFRKILKDWVDQCEVLLPLIGPGWIDAREPKTNQRRLDNKDDFVRIEIGQALARGIPVVPVLLDGTAMPDVDLLPDDLKEIVNRQAEFVEYRTFDADVERLIRRLKLSQGVSRTADDRYRSDGRIKVDAMICPRHSGPLVPTRQRQGPVVQGPRDRPRDGRGTGRLLMMGSDARTLSRLKVRTLVGAHSTTTGVTTSIPAASRSHHVTASAATLAASTYPAR